MQKLRLWSSSECHVQHHCCYSNVSSDHASNTRWQLLLPYLQWPCVKYHIIPLTFRFTLTMSHVWHNCCYSQVYSEHALSTTWLPLLLCILWLGVKYLIIAVTKRSILTMRQVPQDYCFPWLLWTCMKYLISVVTPLSILTMPQVRGSLNKFPDFFRMGTCIDYTHMKL